MMEPKTIIAACLIALIVLYAIGFYCMYKFIEAEKKEQEEIEDDMHELYQFYHDETI